MIRNRVINWQGRRSRIELSHDMLSAEYKLAKKDQEREAILKTIPGGLARVDARDCETVLWYGGKFWRCWVIQRSSLYMSCIPNVPMCILTTGSGQLL